MSEKIKVRMNHVSGGFDLDKDEIVCVARRKYTSVELCFKGNMNIPFAEIKLYDSEKFVDAEATFEDAKRLGDEISARWNEGKK